MRVAPVALVFLVACSGGEGGPIGDGLGGSDPGTGGYVSADGLGGSVDGTGGDPATGGAEDLGSGGSEASGGGTSGGAESGGASGGAPSGGATGAGASSGGSASGGAPATGGGGTGGQDTGPEPSWSWDRDIDSYYFGEASPYSDGYMDIDVSVRCQGWGPWAAADGGGYRKDLRNGDEDIVLDWELPMDRVGYWNCEGTYAGSTRYITVDGIYRLYYSDGNPIHRIQLHNSILPTSVKVSKVRVRVASVEWWEETFPSIYVAEHFTVELLP